MTRLIGTRCTRSNAFSQGVLIARFLLGNLEIMPLLSGKNIRAHCLGGLSRGSHLFPFRTEQLSPVELMIVFMAKVSSCQDCVLESRMQKAIFDLSLMAFCICALSYLLYLLDMVWAQRRKLTYLGGLTLFFGLIAFFVYRHATSVPPTCFDQKKNGGEVGVDCGGGCLQYCPNELVNPKIRWVRSFEVTPGLVHAVAYIEHSYPTAAAREMQYQFKLYDDKNSIITERVGTTYLGPMGRTAIVETLIPVGNNKVATTRFSFLPPIPWEKVDPKFSQVVIKTDRSLLESFVGGTRLTVSLDNQSRYSFSNIDTVALLYDDRDNVITASKIVVPLIPALGKETIYFTWPTKFDPKTIRTIEVVPRFNVYSAKEL